MSHDWSRDGGMARERYRQQITDLEDLVVTLRAKCERLEQASAAQDSTRILRIVMDERDAWRAQSEALAAALDLAITQMEFTDSLDLSKNHTNGPSIVMCKPALEAYNEFKRAQGGGE